ncbi:sugar transferase [Elusimicrobiota bacterium]
MQTVPCGILKSLFDKIFAILAIIILLPLFILIAILIKLEGLIDPEGKGPVFWAQERVSRGRNFRFYKFRINQKTILDEEQTARIRDRNKSLEKSEYCTRTGKLLKKWYLDELPQLFNILKGDMSLVGPRPFPVDDHEDDLRMGIIYKSLIRAGLTGLVQMNKGNPDAKSYVEYDKEYFEYCLEHNQISRFFYDLRIIVRTARTILQGKGL